MTPSKQKKGHPTLDYENSSNCTLLPHWMGPQQKNQMIALILAKSNLSGLAGSYFQLGYDFQQRCPDTVTTRGTSGPACNTHVMRLIYIYLHPQELTGLSAEGEIPFSFTDFQISTMHFFFFYTGTSLHLTTTRTFARQKKHVIKLRDAHTLPFLLSLLLECHAR